MNLIVHKLFKNLKWFYLDLLLTRSSQCAVTINSLKVSCLERKCEDCKNKTIEFGEFEPKDTVTYERWITKNEEVIIKGKLRICKKTVMEIVNTTKKMLLSVYKTALAHFMQHVANYVHQLQAIQKIKPDTCRRIVAYRFFRKLQLQVPMEKCNLHILGAQSLSCPSTQVCITALQEIPPWMCWKPLRCAQFRKTCDMIRLLYARI